MNPLFSSITRYAQGSQRARRSSHTPAKGSRKSRRRTLHLERLEDRTVPSTFTVTNTSDSGAGSLRQAIVDANTNVGLDTISFAGMATGVQTIQLLSALPTVTDAVNIDGTTKSGFAGTPLVELDGNLAGAGADGVAIAASNTTVKGLVINRFKANGIHAGASASNIQISGNYVGVDPTGTVARGNLGIGILVEANATGTVIQSNVVSANTSYGTELLTAPNSRIVGNLIGTNAAGTAKLGNGADGIIIASSDNCTVGGSAADRNVISGNGASGIRVVTAGPTTIQGNYIGTNASGSSALGNTGWGVLAGGGALTLGGSGSGQKNVISGNTGSGVEIDGPGATIQGNTIGLNATDDNIVPNTDAGIRLYYGGGDTIGGVNQGEGNVIAGNLGHGIDVRSNNSVIKGNWGSSRFLVGNFRPGKSKNAGNSRGKPSSPRGENLSCFRHGQIQAPPRPVSVPRLRTPAQGPRPLR